MENTKSGAPLFGLAIKVLLPLLLLSSGAYADVPVPGMKGYDNQYVISNIGDYPDYIFLTSSGIWGWKHTSLVDSARGSFGGGYKLDHFLLHAAKADGFDTSLFASGSLPGQADCTGYCQGSSAIASSSIDLPVSALVNDTIPLESITVYLVVNSINGPRLKVTRERTVYNYENGTSLEAPVQVMS